MTTVKSTLKILTFFVFVFAFASIAQAQTRTWVSGVGDDVNPCSRTAPCKTFAGAISKTAANGEINCLDPGGYGPVTITKSITIDCEDTQGSILASLTNGVILNGTNIDVRLRGISINGAGNGVNCIRVLNSGNNRLMLDEVVCAGFTQHGVSVESSGGTIKVTVWNSSFRNNSGNGINTFVTGVATAQVAVESSMFVNNGVGINTGSATTASIANSIVSSNTTGIQAGNATSVISAKDNQVTHNGTGFSTLVGATMRIGGNLVSGNTTGLSGSNMFSWGQNYVDGNGTNGSVSGAASVQ